MVKKVGTVYQTDDAGMFKKLIGNRAVTDGRVEKIIKSIKTVGYIQSPIIVNENYEIIDGQGRVEALKRLEMPIDYIICPGARLEECISLNINLSNWKLTDYIDSYAEAGNTSYKYIKLLVAEYGKFFELHVILNAVNDLIVARTSYIKGGQIKCDEKAYEKARKMLDYFLTLRDAMLKIPGRARFYYMGINFAITKLNVDKKRLKKRLETLYPTMSPGVDMKVALEELERIYNYNAKEKVYFYNSYQVMKTTGGQHETIR